MLPKYAFTSRKEPKGEGEGEPEEEEVGVEVERVRETFPKADRDNGGVGGNHASGELHSCSAMILLRGVGLSDEPSSDNRLIPECVDVGSEWARRSALLPTR